MTRSLKARAALFRRTKATTDPEAIAQAMTDYVLGRRKNPPTIFIPRRTQP